MADLKKQIIFPKDAEFIAEDESNSGQDTPLQGPIYFDPDDVVLDQPNEKPEIQGVIHFDSDEEITIYPDGVTFNVADLKPAATFNAATGQIEFIEEKQSDKNQEIKPAINIDGPNPNK
jgi:hypothetical protein